MSAALYVFDEPKWPKAAEKADGCISCTKRFRVGHIFSLKVFLSLMNRTPGGRSVSLRLLCTQNSKSYDSNAQLPYVGFLWKSHSADVSVCLLIREHGRTRCHINLCVQKCMTFRPNTFIYCILRGIHSFIHVAMTLEKERWKKSPRSRLCCAFTAFLLLTSKICDCTDIFTWL